MAWYVKYFRCSECGTEWTDEWDCLCDDRCPECNAEIESHDWVEIEDEEAE